MSRWKAAGIHLTLSALMVLTLLLVMFALWYPPPYFQLMGGLGLVILIAGCDVVLGPLCTLIVFKSGKPNLTFDLAMIAMLQAAAMTYGLYTMFEARPVFTVFAVDRFEVAAANEIRGDDLAKASAEFGTLPLTGPRVVGAEVPDDSDATNDLALQSLVRSGALKTRPKLYRPYDRLASVVALKAKPLAGLEWAHPESKAIIESKLTAYTQKRAQLGYLPIVGRFRNMTAVVDKTSGAIEAIVDVAPW